MMDNHKYGNVSTLTLSMYGRPIILKITSKNGNVGTPKRFYV